MYNRACTVRHEETNYLLLGYSIRKEFLGEEASPP